MSGDRRKEIGINDVKISLVLMASCMLVIGGMGMSLGRASEKLDGLSVSVRENISQTDRRITSLEAQLRELESKRAADSRELGEIKALQTAILKELERLKKSNGP